MSFRYSQRGPDYEHKMSGEFTIYSLPEEGGVVLASVRSEEIHRGWWGLSRGFYLGFFSKLHMEEALYRAYKKYTDAA